METGERRWHYQVVRHDVWDADIATPLLLYEAEVDGRPRKALAAMRADGYLFVFDRETGEPLVPIEEREVPQDAFLHTAPTQPFPVGAESILPECSFWRDRVPPPFELSCSTYTPPSVDRHLVVAPGAPIPRVRVTPMSFSPATGYVYAQGHAHVGRARRFEDPWLSRPSGGHISLPDSVGIIAAVDPRTSRVVWKQEAPSPLLGSSGPLTTTGGLMFRGSPGGQVEAYDARTGERVWAFQTTPAGARVRPGPAAAYELAGEQFIAIPMGRELWAFALDGAVAARGEAPADPWADLEPCGPAPRATDAIETAMLMENPSWSAGGRRYAIDEHAFNPGPRPGDGRRARPVRQQRGTGAHRGGARRELDHRRAPAGDVGGRDLRRARHVPVPLHGTSVDGWRNHCGALRRSRGDNRTANMSVPWP